MNVQNESRLVIAINHSSDVAAARRCAKEVSTAVGFDEKGSEEVVLAVSELGSNLLRHASGGVLTLTALTEGGRTGVEIECIDEGPGIADVDNAMADGFSTAGGLGAGLGAVNRLLDDVQFSANAEAPTGTHVVGRRWVRTGRKPSQRCPLDVGVASRRHPTSTQNGDAFVIKRWEESLLVAVVDGLGHGEHAHRAAQAARIYIETHFDLTLESLFQGVARACQGTRGAVIAIARFDWPDRRLTFASVGNVEARVFGSPTPLNFIVRRGIVGANAPKPVVTQHAWGPSYVLVLHTDGVRSHWSWDDFAAHHRQSATLLAQRLLRTLAKNDDDATVAVTTGAHNGD